jgi:hypothetical protein
VALLLRRRLRPRSPLVARLAVLCRQNHRPSRRLIRRRIRSCWVACSQNRHRCRCRSPLRRLRRPNSCVGLVLAGAPLRADSGSPGSAWTAPRADPVLGLGSAQEDSIAAPGSPAEEARDGSAAAEGVSVAAPCFGLPPKKIRMAAPRFGPRSRSLRYSGQRSRSLRYPGWGICGSRGRKSLPRCPGYPSRAASCSPAGSRRPPGCPTSSAACPPRECWLLLAGLASRAPAAPISSLPARAVACCPRADRPR